MNSIPATFRFLRGLTTNNDREWFNEHRGEYEIARTEFESFLSSVITRIPFFDESIRGTRSKDCVYRIYQDTCFSSNKTPYKNHFRGYINAKGRKSNHSGYYVHIQSEGCMLVRGNPCLPPNVLKILRQPTYDNIDGYHSIVEDPEFKKFFSVVGEDFLKAAPKGFPRDFKYIDYSKLKEFTCTYSMPDSFFPVPDILDKAEEVFRQFRRFANFTSLTIDDFE